MERPHVSAWTRGLNGPMAGKLALVLVLAFKAWWVFFGDVSHEAAQQAGLPQQAVIQQQWCCAPMLDANGNRVVVHIQGQTNTQGR